MSREKFTVDIHSETKSKRLFIQPMWLVHYTISSMYLSLALIFFLWFFGPIFALVHDTPAEAEEHLLPWFCQHGFWKICLSLRLQDIQYTTSLEPHDPIVGHLPSSQRPSTKTECNYLYGCIKISHTLQNPTKCGESQKLELGIQKKDCRDWGFHLTKKKKKRKKKQKKKKKQKDYIYRDWSFHLTNKRKKKKKKKTKKKDHRDWSFQLINERKEKKKKKKKRKKETMSLTWPGWGKHWGCWCRALWGSTWWCRSLCCGPEGRVHSVPCSCSKSTHTHAHTHTHTHTCTHTHVHTYTHTQICTQSHTHTHAVTQSYTNTAIHTEWEYSYRYVPVEYTSIITETHGPLEGYQHTVQTCTCTVYMNFVENIRNTWSWWCRSLCYGLGGCAYTASCSCSRSIQTFHMIDRDLYPLCAHTHTHMRACVCMWICVCVCVHVNMCVCVCVRARILMTMYELPVCEHCFMMYMQCAVSVID